MVYKSEKHKYDLIVFYKGTKCLEIQALWGCVRIVLSVLLRVIFTGLILLCYCLSDPLNKVTSNILRCSHPESRFTHYVV